MRNILGCQLWWGKKICQLELLKERVWEKLQGWKETILSQVGREVLFKAVV